VPSLRNDRLPPEYNHVSEVSWAAHSRKSRDIDSQGHEGTIKGLYRPCLQLASLSVLQRGHSR
jgi:hypothetical protein